MPQLAVRLRKFDVIHLHLPFITGAETVWALKKLTGKPLVATYHNDFVHSGTWRDPIYRMATVSMRLTVMRAANVILFVSEGHARTCDQRWVMDARPTACEVLPNTIDTDLFRPASGGDRESARLRWKVPPDRFVAVVVSTLDPAHAYKGVDTAIRAIAALPKQPIDLVVVGEGPLRSEYASLADALGVADRVRFVGSVDHLDMPSIYHAADIVLMPSRAAEAFPLVALEASASSLPVIASDGPGIRAIVRLETGFVVDPSGTDQFANMASVLYSDAALRSRLGAGGRQLVERQFSDRTLGESLATIYLRAAEPRARRPMAGS
jgi:glycosyltransferase involved in cell wall biosynthesis